MTVPFPKRFKRVNELQGKLGAQKDELRDYFFERVWQVAIEFPDLRTQFSDQFTSASISTNFNGTIIE